MTLYQASKRLFCANSQTQEFITLRRVSRPSATAVVFLRGDYGGGGFVVSTFRIFPDPYAAPWEQDRRNWLTRKLRPRPRRPIAFVDMWNRVYVAPMHYNRLRDGERFKDVFRNGTFLVVHSGTATCVVRT